MGWFDNQINERRKADQELLEDSFIQVAGVLLGQQNADMLQKQWIVTRNTIEEILKYYHYKPVDIPNTIEEPMEQLDYCLRVYGIMRRDAELEKGWYKDAYGPMLAFMKEDGSPVALLPGKISGYYFNDPKTGKKCRMNSKTSELFSSSAICFYRPLPMKKVRLRDLVLYMRRCVTRADNIILLLITLAVILVGLILPAAAKALTGPVLSSGRGMALIGIAICIFCVVLSSQMISTAKGLSIRRIITKINLGVQASMMMRLISLPASFFRGHSTGELQSRMKSVDRLCQILVGVGMNAVIMIMTALLYIVQILHFAPMLVIPSLLTVLATVLLSVFTTRIQIRVNKKQMEQAALESGMSYSMISGVQKIKLAGAEKRIFALWMQMFSRSLRLSYNPPLLLKVNTVLNTAISLISTIVLYFIAVQSDLEPSSYFAFNAAYGAVMGALSSIGTTTVSAAAIKPILDMAEPFFETEPECSEGGEVVTSISGGLELDHIWFRYSEDMPYIIKDLSLKIDPGDYVAICGKTGCGKSTLIRLLLGFEEPEKGSVYYDSKDIKSMEPGSLRRKIGVVLQNGKLFTGDIYQNIVITAPELSQEAAWEAAEIAGIADDIRRMPMGMNTLISEGGGGISGGQKQRLMIARAVAPKPKLLILDEATSALDNKTQKQVAEALDKMGCTRIVIAHRLSTIRQCKRILVLDEGRIIEDGSFEELIAKNGLFAELVERQRLDN